MGKYEVLCLLQQRLWNALMVDCIQGVKENRCEE